MRIKLLPQIVRDKVRTEFVYEDVKHYVASLVENALDANAKHIRIFINREFYKLQVIDDGIGMTIEDMNFVGIRNMTNKCQSLIEFTKTRPYYGYRGEALSNLIEAASKLTIVSKFNEDDTYCKVFEKGRLHELGKTNDERPCRGSSITVEGLYYKHMQRRLTFGSAIELQEIIRFLESMSVIHPTTVFIFKDETRNELLFKNKSTTNPSCAFQRLMLPYEKCRRSGSSNSSRSNSSLINVKCKRQHYKASAIICRIMLAEERNLQYCYINRKFIWPDGGKILYQLMNRYLKCDDGEHFCRSNGAADDFLNKYPMFVANFSCPHRIEDAIFPTDVNYDILTSCIRLLVDEFFAKCPPPPPTVIRTEDDSRLRMEETRRSGGGRSSRLSSDRTDRHSDRTDRHSDRTDRHRDRTDRHCDRTDRHRSDDDIVNEKDNIINESLSSSWSAALSRHDDRTTTTTTTTRDAFSCYDDIGGRKYITYGPSTPSSKDVPRRRRRRLVSEERPSSSKEVSSGFKTSSANTSVGIFCDNCALCKFNEITTTSADNVCNNQNKSYDKTIAATARAGNTFNFDVGGFHRNDDTVRQQTSRNVGIVSSSARNNNTTIIGNGGNDDNFARPNISRIIIRYDTDEQQQQQQSNNKLVENTFNFDFEQSKFWENMIFTQSLS